MTQQQRELFKDGQIIAHVFYQCSDGRDTLLRPSAETIRKLARMLDLTQTRVRAALELWNYGEDAIR